MSRCDGLKVPAREQVQFAQSPSCNRFDFRDFNRRLTTSDVQDRLVLWFVFEIRGLGYKTMTSPDVVRFAKKFEEQLQFIRRSAEAFDQGSEQEALRIATSLRVIFHQRVPAHL